jgi:hypothetical protein
MATKAQLVENVLNRLRSALGTSEHPPGSNYNFIVQWYNDNVDKIGRGAWCEMTNTWAMWTGGVKSLKNGRAYTVWAAQDAQKGINGSSWHWGTKGMQAGDQVYYNWDGRKAVELVDHTGTAEKIVGNGTFYVLEGNTGDMLKRKLRDSKYVVGYVRFNWESLVTIVPGPSPIPKPPLSGKPTPNRAKTLRVQDALEVTKDGEWGSKTDARATRLRAAARAHAGYPKNTPWTFNIRDVQDVIDTRIDGVWGPNSQAALVKWIKYMQAILGVEIDGKWGPATDNAFLKLRAQNLNNF